MPKEKNTPTPTERSYKTIYISISAEDYEKIAKAAKENCRSVGGELLYGWKKSNEKHVVYR